MNIFNECCTFIINNLPKAELPFVPALLLGTFFSSMFLLYLYKKHHRTTTWHAFKEMVKDIFVHFPVLDHAEFMKCDNANCVRCRQSEALKESVVSEWKALAISEDKNYQRIADSIKSFVEPACATRSFEAEKRKKNKRLNQKPTLFYMDLPANPIWTDLDVFRIEREIIKLNFEVIRKEYENVFQVFQNGDTYGWKKNTIPEGHWCIFSLIDQGIINNDNVNKCPNLATLFRSLPSLMQNCVFGNVCFSLLYNDSHIEPHYGPTNIRLRCHFGLSIPNDCWLEVDGQQMRWKDEDVIVFDDSFQHSAYFGPKKTYVPPRVILLMDFWHPSITSDEKEILLKLFKPVEKL